MSREWAYLWGEIGLRGASIEIGMERKDLLERVKSLRYKTQQRFAARNQLQKHLRSIVRQAEVHLRTNRLKTQCRILWSPGFNINRYFWIHDGLLSTALRLRGAEIVPLMCGQLQAVECNMFGGVWSGSAGWRRSCDGCAVADLSMWQDTMGLLPVNLSRYVRPEEKMAAQKAVETLDESTWQSFEHDSLPIGWLARNSVINLNNLGRLDGVDLALNSGRNYIYNALLLCTAYQRVLDKVKPDRVLCHDGTYLMWDLLDRLAERRGIPYFTYYSGARKDTWHYVRNGVTLQMDLSPAWETWRQGVLTDEQNARLDAYLDERRLGSAFVLNPVPAKQQENNESMDFLAQLDPSKPTALLAANVVWDAAALDKAVFFPTMFDWIVRTIDYFRQHPEFQLIVKPHPIEVSLKIPRTQHTVLGELERSGMIIPPNVFQLSPDTPVSAYDLYPYCKLGLIWTSTVGLELSMIGVPVILVGRAPFQSKGFTVDPVQAEEYFAAITSRLTTPESPTAVAERIRLSRLYFYLYYFVYFIDTGIFPWRFWDEPAVCTVQSYEELLPGANMFLDYVCDAILQDRPVLGPDRWPPES
jgi:hypothetical protein